MWPKRADFKPGQYITLITEIDGDTARRNYSLSDSPDNPYYRISVKREDGGRVSNHLHASLQVGDTVRLTPPCGDFVLDDSERPLVLLSGGVGVTPTISMLKTALKRGREVHFLHGALNSATHAFKGLIESLRQQYDNLHVSYCYSEPLASDKDIAHGFFDQARLSTLLPLDKDPEVYFLGPKPFMQSCYRALNALQVPQQRIRYEFFGPLEVLEAASA